MRFAGRERPYSERGVRRVPCIRCGALSIHQWQICANGRRYVACCLDCDIELNALVLEFMKIPDAAGLMLWYETIQRVAHKEPQV